MGGVSLTQLQTTFASGELDPTLRGQRDIKAYKEGCTRARNVQRRASGGLERRPGTYLIGTLAASSRLEGFEFAADQRYVVAFSAGKLEIFGTDGALLQTVLSCPWDATTKDELTTTQQGDIMVICHTAFWPVVLRRTGTSTFTLTDLVFEVAVSNDVHYQPYFKFVEPEVTLTPSGSTGSITLTAKKGGVNYSLFEAGHVGQRFRIYDCEVSIDSLVNAWTANATVGGTLEGKLDLDPFKVSQGSNVVEVLHLYHGLETGSNVQLSGGNSVGGVPAAEFTGTFTITVIDEHRYKITLTTVSFNYWEDHDGDGTPTSRPYTAPRISEDGGGPSVKFGVVNVPTRRWMEPSFSPVRGYPGACAFHQGRLWLGGSESQPDGEWGSNALQPFRFDAGKGYDADSVQVAGGSEDVSRIRHMVAHDDLQMFTPTAELVFEVRDGEPITPNNARVINPSNAGCNSAQPAPYDGATLFIQENGLSVFEWARGSNGRYQATAVSTLAGHLVGKPKQIAVTPGTTQRAEQFAFFVNTEGTTPDGQNLYGTVSVFHSMRAENIAGWSLWVFGGSMLVESVCCVGSDVFFAVNDSSGNYFLWRLADSDNACLDGCVVHNAAPTTSWVFDADLHGLTCDIVTTNGTVRGYHGQAAISATPYVFPTAQSLVTVGYGFYATVETLPPSLQLASGERSGLIKRVVRSVIDFDGAFLPTVNGVRIDDTAVATANSAVTGPYEMYHMGYERDPTLELSQDAPLPWRVLSVLQEVSV